jgi:hypothetical protein
MGTTLIRLPGSAPARASAAFGPAPGLALLATLAALTIGAAIPAAAGASLPPQGLYEQCAPNSATMDCGQRLKTMAAAGFAYVLNYTAWYGDEQQVLRFADQAQAAGMKVIWPLNHPSWRDGSDMSRVYRYLWPDCGCSTNAGFERFAIDLVKDHPATWGFYIGDEVIPTPDNVAQVSGLVDEVRQIAPGKPLLYITLPRQDLIAQLEPFAPLADVAGTDYYPIGLAPDLTQLPTIAATTDSVTTKNGKRSALVLQAFSWSQYELEGSARFPTRGEMLRMRNMALDSGHPDFLFWYSFNDVFDTAQPIAHWSDLRAAAFAPHIEVDRVPARCRSSRLRFKVTVSTAARLRRARAMVDGKVLRRTSRHRFSVRVRTERLRAGRHRIQVVAADRAGHRAIASTRFRSCRR